MKAKKIISADQEAKLLKMMSLQTSSNDPEQSFSNIMYIGSQPGTYVY